MGPVQVCEAARCGTKNDSPLWALRNGGAGPPPPPRIDAAAPSGGVVRYGDEKMRIVILIIGIGTARQKRVLE